MPTYQYACTECGHRFEAVQSFSDAALSECPQCSGRLRKLFSSVGVVFKGSGFYRTDSRAAAKGDGGKEGGGGKEPVKTGAGAADGASSGTSSSGTSSPGPSSSGTSSSGTSLPSSGGSAGSSSPSTGSAT